MDAEQLIKELREIRKQVSLLNTSYLMDVTDNIEKIDEAISRLIEAVGEEANRQES